MRHDPVVAKHHLRKKVEIRGIVMTVAKYCVEEEIKVNMSRTLIFENEKYIVRMEIIKKK